MTLFNVSRAWKPENGRAYGIVEVRMAQDFERDDSRLWGIVNARDIDRTTSFKVLRVIGAPGWHPRFDLMNNTPDTYDKWQTHLGGGGAWTALSGVHAYKAKLSIDRLEVFGAPGCGILTEQCQNLKIGSGLCDRTGWPVVQTQDPGGSGASIKNLVSRDHWFSKAWGDVSMKRGVSLRRMEPLGIGARGELTVVASSYEVLNYTHIGDGISWKLSGTRFRVSNFHGGACFLNGVVPSNVTTYPDPIAYRHLHEAKDIVVEDSIFTGMPFSDIQSNALLYVSYPFTNSPVFSRCTFIKGRHKFAFQVNWASVTYNECDFIGWADQAAAFELSPASPDGMPAASVSLNGCRFHGS